MTESTPPNSPDDSSNSQSGSPGSERRNYYRVRDTILLELHFPEEASEDAELDRIFPDSK